MTPEELLQQTIEHGKANYKKQLGEPINEKLEKNFIIQAINEALLPLLDQHAKGEDKDAEIKVLTAYLEKL